MLTKEALIERRKGVGASDANKIISGEWFALWQDKMGLTEPEDLSGVWPVQLGVATETLNLDWYARKRGPVTRRGEHIISAEYPMLRCTLDGYDAGLPAIVEAKHVNGFSKLPEVIERYTPQVMHQMCVAQVPHAFLTIIVGSNEPVIHEVEYDEFWTMMYVDRCVEFWKYVESGKEPPGRPEPMAPPVSLDKMREVDMSGNNAWSNDAADWIAHGAAARKFSAAEKGIKAAVQADVRRAWGHGIEVKRNGAGLKITGV